MNRNCLLLIIIVVLSASCKTNGLYINVLHPAPVTLPEGVKKVGIINRSIPTDETELAAEVEKVLTLEGADLDKDGAWEGIAGMSDELKANNRFEEVKLLNDFNFRSSAFGVLPTPLNARLVDSICRETGTDALFALERFDTDTNVEFSTPSGTIKTPVGNIPVIGLEVTMETIIKTGWRIYAPYADNVVDEYSFAESLFYTSKGKDPITAMLELTSRKDVIRQVSRNAGVTYATRILPYRIRVTRDYYVKGTDNFRVAKRKAQNGKWDEAGKLWESELTNHDSKIAGRACYNMAIINEINGNLEEALGWAQKAYEDYNIKRALDYAGILENRMSDEDLLKIQEK